MLLQSRGQLYVEVLQLSVESCSARRILACGLAQLRLLRRRAVAELRSSILGGDGGLARVFAEPC